MTQILLFPDPRPLVERLGPHFFRQAPDGPGVYLMRDAANEVLYVGKALEELAARLEALFSGDAEQFIAWARERTAAQTHPFEVASREADLEALCDFAERAAERVEKAQSEAARQGRVIAPASAPRSPCCRVGGKH